MGRTKYQKGYALENKLVNSLKKKHKFLYAARMAGSHSVADVIGITPNGITIFFQCKSSDNETIYLTDIMQGDNVVKLRQLPDSIRKVLVIKQGFKHNSSINCYRWIEQRNRWIKIPFKI